jgi:CHAD domain-containing protein
MEELNNDMIYDITSSHYKKLKELLEKALASFDPEAIHLFRVAYKKCRAFLRMVPGMDLNKKQPAISKRLRNIYEICGTIRNLQLQQQRILETVNQVYKPPSGYLARLQEMIKKYKHRLLSLTRDNSLKAPGRKMFMGAPVLFTGNDVGAYVKDQLDHIKSYISSVAVRDKDLHAVRKRLKDIFYNIKIYKEQDAVMALPVKWKRTGTAFFDRLLKELGDFQDHCTAISLLKPANLKGLDRREKQILERLKREWKIEKNRKARSIIKKIKLNLDFNFIQGSFI